MKLLPLVLLIAVMVVRTSLAPAQIPNPGFETWTDLDPDGWVTGNTVGLVTVTQTTDRHSGNLAARGEVLSFIGFPITPSLTTGNDTVSGFPVSQRHASWGGFYKFAPLGNDRVFVTAVMSSADTGIGAGSALLEAASSFTSFTVPITYISTATPTSAVISFQIISADSLTPFPTVGSSFIVDDVAFSGLVSVDEEQNGAPAAFALGQNYPNPFNGETRIGYRVRGAGEGTWVNLRVYDMLGREVATLVNERKAPGEYSVGFDAGKLSSGVYLYRLQAGNAVETRRMILLR